jgi:hypothetical protein
MKTEDVKLGEELNKKLWARGISNPPHKVTVVVKKEENVAYAELAGHDFKKKDFAEQEEKPKKETRGVDEAVLKEAAGKKDNKTSVMDVDAAEVIGKAAVAKNKAEAKETEKPKAEAKPAAKKTAKK